MNKRVRKITKFAATLALALGMTAGIANHAQAAVDASTYTSFSTITDSINGFSGVQGQDNWYHGWYNYTADVDSTYAAGDFQPFAPDASGGTGGSNYHWTGTNYDNAAGGAPWVNLSAETAHPNGINSPPNEEHWTIRRYQVPAGTSGDLDVLMNLRAQNLNGPGTTIALFHNGSLVDQLGNASGTNASATNTVNVSPGDFIDLALTPVNAGLDITTATGSVDRSDGSDGSAYSMSLGMSITEVRPFAGTQTVIVADSVTDWDTTGQNGSNGWTYGLYNQTADGDGTYQVGDFTPGAPASDAAGAPSTDTSGLHWTGSKYDYAGNPPWTEVGQSAVHPNGSNNTTVEWAMRRYEVQEDHRRLLIDWHAYETNPNSDGVTGRVFVNGVEVDTVVANAQGATPNRRVALSNVSAGDIIDIAIDPTGATGGDQDFSDGAGLDATIRVPVYTGGEIANSITQFSGVQGQDGWHYGYFNKTQDDIAADLAQNVNFTFDEDFGFQTDDFIAGTNDGVDYSFDGFNWDWAAGNPPWTFMSSTGVHPNGSNNGDIHESVRRWVSDFEGEVLISGAIQKNGGGSATITTIYINGEAVWSGSTANGQLVEYGFLADLQVGDIVDVLTGPGLDGHDGADSTNVSTIITAVVPEPGVFGLLAIAGGMLGMRRRRK